MKVSKFDAYLMTLSLEYLQCRDFGHSWAPYTARRIGSRFGGFESVLRCPRCKVRRIRTLSRTGTVLASHYDYREAVGYLIKGLGHLTVSDRDKIRLNNLLLNMLVLDPADEEIGS